MKVSVEMIGFVTHLSGGEKWAEVELPGDSATAGEVLVKLSERYDEKFGRLSIDTQKHVIKLMAMRDGKVIVYDTPVKDGEHIQLTITMDGGC